MRIFSQITLSTIIFIQACSSNNNQKREKIENNKINNEKPKEILKEDTLKAIFEFYNQDSVNLEITKINLNPEKTFIQRFPYKNATNLLLESKKNLVKHLQINYADSNAMKNAFFNYLDCYGKDCKSIELFQKVKFSKTFFMLITTTKSIHIIESENNLNSSDWINCVRFSKIADPIKFIIIQKKQQKAKWFRYSNYHLTEVK
ncbi:MAG: hypothetical protein NTY55_03105 [Flavobacteriia bacterium]|nr:hypothetical protein [Flavobacteriia bacterium]